MIYAQKHALIPLSGLQLTWKLTKSQATDLNASDLKCMYRLDMTAAKFF